MARPRQQHQRVVFRSTNQLPLRIGTMKNVILALLRKPICSRMLLLARGLCDRQLENRMRQKTQMPSELRALMSAHIEAENAHNMPGPLATLHEDGASEDSARGPWF